MDEDSLGGLSPLPDQEDDNKVSCLMRPVASTEELPAANNESILSNESHRELVALSPVTESSMPNEESKDLTADPESSNITSNEGSEEVQVAKPNASSVMANEGNAEIVTASDEPSSIKPNEDSNDLTAAEPESSNITPNEGSEEVQVAKPNASSVMANEGNAEIVTASDEPSSIKPNEDSKDLTAAEPQSSNITPNEGSEEVQVAKPNASSVMANEGNAEIVTASDEPSSIKSNEGSKDLTAADPKSSNITPNEGSEEVQDAKPNTSSVMPNDGNAVVTASHEPNSIMPNEYSKELKVTKLEANSVMSNQAIEEVADSSPENSMRPKGGVELRVLAANVQASAIKLDKNSVELTAASSRTDTESGRIGLVAASCTNPVSEPGPSNVYRPPPMRAGHQNRNGAGSTSNSSVPTVPTFEQFLLQQEKEKKRKGSFVKENINPYSSTRINRSNQSFNRDDPPQRQRQQYSVRDMSCNTLAEISCSDSVTILEKISRQKESFKKLIESSPGDRNRDVFALVLELISNVWKTSFEESKKLLLLEICNSKFMDNLQLYLMQLPYVESRRDKFHNKRYWTKENEFWSNFMTLCECIINVSPSTAVRKCGVLIEASSKSCLDGLKEKHNFELPADYSTRMSKIRDGLRKQVQIQKTTERNVTIEPLESFRELSLLPTREELLERRPFLRPNVVEGAYSHVDHYLDVQFRLLREDCFGPLREGIHQYIADPKKRKYDHIRVYRDVKFVGPFFTKQKFGSLVLLDKYTEKMFKKTNWKQSKRLIFGSLVLFTKDNCKSFRIGTILQRDEELLSKRLLGVSIIDSKMDSDLYNDDLYTMIECEVYFEPYYHVLKAMQDPSFPENLSMSKYIVDVQQIPENPAYLAEDTVYILNPKRQEHYVRMRFLGNLNQDEDESLSRNLQQHDGEQFEIAILKDETWPSETELGLDRTQYEAYKLALTREFAVIQGPPGTGKTFLGVKVAEAILENAPLRHYTCSLLVICYTNHALDQFLESLIPITDSIVRIGGRSQSQLLEKYNIKNFRGRACYEERAELEYRINKLKDFYEACITPEVVLSFSTVVTYVEESEKIYNYSSYRGEFVDDLKYWLFDYDIVPELLENCFVNERNRKSHKKIDVDNDIYARDEFELDDDAEEFCRMYNSSTLVSFSLPEAEEQIDTLSKEWQYINEKLRREEYDDFYFDLLNRIENTIIRLQSDVKLFKDMMICQSRAPTIDLWKVRDLSEVPLVERWSFYYKWANIAKGQLKKQSKKREELVRPAAEVYEEARMMSDCALLRSTKVIGMTTSAAARLRKLLVEVGPPIVIVEEAAEVLEAHIVTSLTKSCQHLILIGDHQQLRPSAAYMRLARHYDLEVSLFERMIRNGVHSRRLGVQHRMRPEIAALVSPHIYPDLQNHRSVEDFPPVRGVAHNLYFFSHNYMEQSEEDSSSRTNTMEADFTLRLANYLMQQGYKSDEVTIVAAYSGQMFYMRQQRSSYYYLADVKITVLDNYQGEESKIILLSLVRNNDNDSIGFLGTENRICVALSRAREGFFILGNIDLLKRNSTLWTNIAQTLADNGSLGSSLNLKCENHGRITTITSVEDFVKVPEGGCLLNCKHNMPCGHPCPRMCHAYDIAHTEIQCTRPCERKICEIEGHNCPFNCSKKCQPCTRVMKKLLPCGHTRPVQCYLAPDDPFVYCHEQVTVTLPGCGHEATKLCYVKISNVECVEKCEAGRLSCGHACIRRCHVKDDPEHENYKCEKPCTRPKKDCSANLGEDLGDHQCPLPCGEPCTPCDVQVTKKRSGCKHSNRVACREDVNAQICRQKCARSLPCGHHCKKLCWEKCGDCKQKVKKTIPDCNHEIETECGMTPTRQLCTKKCERTMTCGHQCPTRCDKPCDPATCLEVTNQTTQAICGHSVMLPCDLYQAKQSGSIPAAKLLAACTAPCGAVLLCGHTCSGSCSGCHQGRLHQPCAARCHQLNICGHRCEEPCNQVCPPCRRRCSVKCPHSVCGKPCGAPCTPCVEPCTRSCSHSTCTRLCGAACSRTACDAACARALPCGHPCRGLCGEPCPPACRVCDPDRFPTDLLGDPYQDDDKLIQLQDCPHILDVDTLDTLMKCENETIQIKACPMCREPIVNTYRYKDLVNKMLKNDINPIKERVYGTIQQRSKKRGELIAKVKDLAESRKLARENTHWNTAYNALHYVIGGKNKQLSVLHFDMYHIYLDILADIGDYYTKYIAQNLTELKTEMHDQLKLICGALVTSKQKISQQQQVDLGREMRRMNSIVQLSTILQFSKNSNNPEVLELQKCATEAVLTWSVYDEEKAVECLKKLEKAVELSGIAGKEEREMIVRAIGLKAGHWYKCPNGHFYCIGECGGAMQLSRCPDCGAQIGGQSHTLTAGNQHAREMDGSRFAAWSEEANNMANFRLD